jgi:hypothetical protein
MNGLILDVAPYSIPTSSSEPPVVPSGASPTVFSSSAGVLPWIIICLVLVAAVGVLTALLIKEKAKGSRKP